MSASQPGRGDDRLGHQLKLISRHLDSNGDGTGNKNFIANYSAGGVDPVGQEIAFIQPPAGKIYRIARMLVLISGKDTNFKTDQYGSVDPLVTGVQIRIQDDSGTVNDLTDGLPIQTNGCWARVAYNSRFYGNVSSNLNDYLRVRWTFENAGQQIRLIGDRNERLEAVFSDDFTDPASSPLVKHYFMVQGYEEDPAEI